MRVEQRGGAARRRVGRSEAQDMALDRSYRWQPGLGQSLDAGQAGSRRHQDDVGGRGGCRRRAPRTGLASTARTGPGRKVTPRRLPGRHQGPQQGPVVHVVVTRHLDAPAHRRAERRDQLGGTRWRCAGAPTQPERVLVGEEVVEAGPVRGVERHGQRPAGVVADLADPDAASRAVANAGQRLAPSSKQGGEGGLAELGLGDRGQHPGGHPAGAVTPGVGGDHRHLVPAPCQIPGARQPDDTASDHGDPLDRH